MCDLTPVFKNYSNHLKKIEEEKDKSSKGYLKTDGKPPSTNCTAALGNFKFNSTLNESHLAQRLMYPLWNPNSVSQVLKCQQLQLRVSSRHSLADRLVFHSISMPLSHFPSPMSLTEEGRGRSCWRCGERRRRATEERIRASRRRKQHL